MAHDLMERRPSIPYQKSVMAISSKYTRRRRSGRKRFSAQSFFGAYKSSDFAAGVFQLLGA
jgi:hypothetical protein